MGPLFGRSIDGLDLTAEIVVADGAMRFARFPIRRHRLGGRGLLPAAFAENGGRGQ